ncbi:MAG: alpha/beta hydrolase [Verrucomicrobiota bacterium]|nr:alpha/beta hydrolase [Verrucomicrobiota bacterium]
MSGYTKRIWWRGWIDRLGQAGQCPCVIVSRLILLVVCAASIGQAGWAQESRQDKPLLTGYKVIRNIPYAGTDNARQSLDLALPLKRASGKPLSVIAFIHGGAWRAGSKDGGLRRIRGFLNSGKYAGMSIGYRLSDEAKWPAQIHDCKAAIRWIKANAEKHGLDGGKIAVHGTSAGGHLVAMLGTSAGVKAMDGSVGPHTDHNTKVACVVDYFGPTNFLRMDDFESRIVHDAADSPESQLIGCQIQDNQRKTLTADPISYVSKEDSPFLIMHGTEDMAVPYNQSVILHSALKKADVPSALLTVTGGGHGVGGGVLDEYVQKFIDHHLLNKRAVFENITIPVSKTARR